LAEEAPGSSPAFDASIDRGQSLVRGLSNTGVSVLYSNLDLDYVWAENVPPA